MALITSAEKNKLFLHVKHELGFPLRPFEIKEDMLMSYLEMVTEDYSSLLNNWLIHQQWISLEGLSKSNSDFISAFSTKSNNYMRSFTYAYSKQVGLGTNAPAAHGWELKRDFIITVADTQHYLIPAGREINEVLWEVPPEVDAGMIDPMALNAWSPGMAGWSYLGRPSMYVAPTYSALLSAQDRGMKQRVLQSILTYRITGLETGEKMLHLYPIPGSRFEIAYGWGKHYAGRKVWYWYYDTIDSSSSDIKKLLKTNPDIVQLPSDVPVEVLQWSNLNDIAKQQIRNLLIAKVKMVIGGVRGFYTGTLGVAEAQLVMDYRHLLDEGQKLKEDTEKIIMDALDKLSQVNLTKERAEIADAVNRERQYQPMRTPIIPI
jgi:hypothetical protein